jgi:hypothetical protein
MAKRQSWKNKAGKKLLTYALDLFFCFESDEIEDELEYAINKFKGAGYRDWRKRVRAYLWSKPAIKDAICERAVQMFEEK